MYPSMCVCIMYFSPIFYLIFRLKGNISCESHRSHFCVVRYNVGGDNALPGLSLTKEVAFNINVIYKQLFLVQMPGLLFLTD